MKKSTILMLVVIYIVAFFVVGLLGVSIRSHYQVNYVEELLVKPLEETQEILQEDVENGGHSVEEIKNEEDVDHIRYNRKYTYRTVYQADLVLKFKIQVMPENSTYNKFETEYTEKPNIFTVDVNDDSTVYIHVKKKGVINIKFLSTDANRTESDLYITVFKEGTVLKGDSIYTD